jgi:arylsulfatase
MRRREFLSALAGAAASRPSQAAARRPNIILMMADDMGYSDLGCYGAEIATPHLDRLAKRGVRFRHFYNTARCCPTRASLMTGLYPHQAGVGHMVDTGKPDMPGYRGDLNRSCVTIAEALKPAGYRTYMAGKWHVTPVTDSKHNWPLQRGFDRFYGTIHGAGSFYDPVTLTRDNEPVEPDIRDFYYTDAIAGNSVRFIADHGKRAEPFFLYCAFTSPHWPLHALEADIAKYRGRYRDGWDALRAERHRRMIAMSLIERRWPLTPRDRNVPAWKDAPHKDWQQRRMEVYSAQVDRMDQGIGRILEKLTDLAIMDDTLILFLADNGGCAEELTSSGRGRHFPARRRDGGPVYLGNDPSRMPGGEDTYQSYGIPWANASNTPFRLYKHWVHEGGIASPLIAHWPAGIRKPGRMTDQPGHLIDIMATCCDAAGARYPERYNGERITPLEGKSLTGILKDSRGPGPRELYWEHEGNRAIREGNWKLVSRYPGQWELFDLEADRTEMNDLAARNPAKAAALQEKWNHWAARCGVEPWERVRKT